MLGIKKYFWFEKPTDVEADGNGKLFRQITTVIHLHYMYVCEHTFIGFIQWEVKQMRGRLNTLFEGHEMDE